MKDHTRPNTSPTTEPANPKRISTKASQHAHAATKGGAGLVAEDGRGNANRDGHTNGDALSRSTSEPSPSSSTRAPSPRPGNQRTGGLLRQVLAFRTLCGQLRNRPPVLAAALLLALAASACGGADHTHDEASATTQGTATPAVAFEPAYPAEVSTEGLSARDEEQQAPHSHGGEAHTHDGDGADHDHPH